MSLECDFLRGINFLAVIQITSTARKVSLPPWAYVDEAHTLFLSFSLGCLPSLLNYLFIFMIIEPGLWIESEAKLMLSLLLSFLRDDKSEQVHLLLRPRLMPASQPASTNRWDLLRSPYLCMYSAYYTQTGW